TLHGHMSPFPSLPSGAGEGLDVDTSLYEHLASNGRRWGDDVHWTVRIDLTGSYFVFDREAARIDLYQPHFRSCLVDTVRLIKGIVTTGIEKNGAIQIHSAGVVLDDEQAVLIAGDMWQGKTTLLLELL